MISPCFSQEGGRRALWSVNAVKILKIGYEDEEDPQVMEAYERLGSLVSFLSDLLIVSLSSLIAFFCDFYLLIYFSW